MTAKEDFISEIEKLLLTNTINEDAMTYFTEFKNGTVKNSKVITEKGAIILKLLQSKPKDYIFTSKMIAEEVHMSSRSVSGTFKKLVTDKFIEKVNTTSPISYQITDMGMGFDLDNIENK